jgi:uroporphyrinogen decarboxylase
MNRKSLIWDAIKGNKPGRVPFTFWMEGPAGDWKAEENALRTWRLYDRWHLDLLKAGNGRFYEAESLGAGIRQDETGRWFVESPWDSPDDIREFPLISEKEGALKREFSYMKHLLESVESGAPVLFTVRSPAQVLTDMCSGLRHLPPDRWGSHAERLLSQLTDMFCVMVQRVIALGADGIFLELPLASGDIMEESLYRKYVMPYDLAVLSSSSGWCNVIHAGGKNIPFALLRKYPAQIFSWDWTRSLPSVEEASFLCSHCLMTGPSAGSICDGRKNDMEYEMFRAWKDTGGMHWIMAPGTALPQDTEEDCISSWRRSFLEMNDIRGR